MGQETYFTVEEIKALRVEVDALIQKVNAATASRKGPETSDGYKLYSLAHYQAEVALIRAKIWLGKMLEGLGNPFPKELADKAEPVQ